MLAKLRYVSQACCKTFSQFRNAVAHGLKAKKKCSDLTFQLFN